MATRILKCSCEHKFQDKKNGKGKRVMNERADSKGYRCTVCGRNND